MFIFIFIYIVDPWWWHRENVETLVKERKKRENEGIKMIVPTLVVLFLLKLRFPTNTPISDSIYVSNHIKSVQIKELTLLNEHIEINTIRITVNSTTYILCDIYRPHSKHEDVEEFTDVLSTVLQKNTIKNEKVIIIGDLNINILEHTTHNATNNYLAALQIYSFFPHISRPSRFPDNVNLSEPSLLDHIYTNFYSNFTSGIIHYSVSDHLPVFINFSVDT